MLAEHIPVGLWAAAIIFFAAVCLFFYFAFRPVRKGGQSVAINDGDDELDEADLVVGQQEGVQRPEKEALERGFGKGGLVVHGTCGFQQWGDPPPKK